MSGVGLDKCSLLSVFVESVFWGLLLSLYMITIFLLLKRKSSIAKHVPHLVLVTVMFVLCTLHVSLNFARVGKAFFGTQDPVIYLGNISETLYRFQYGVLFVLIFFGDLLIIFRSFTLWNKNYFIVFGPTLMAVGTLAAAGGALHAMSVSPRDASFNSQVQAWATASYALALATKVTCLFLVMFRVQQIHSIMTANVNRHVKIYTLLLVLVESGTAALLMAAIVLPTFVSRLNTHVIVRDALSPITGITVTTIIAGMTINLSTPGSPAAASRPAWNRYSMPRPPASPSHAKRDQWNEFDDDAESIPKTPSPVASRTDGIYHVNQSTGTLNMAIVL